MHLFTFVFIKYYIYEQKDTVYICTQTEYIIYTCVCIYISIYMYVYKLLFEPVASFLYSPINQKR